MSTRPKTEVKFLSEREAFDCVHYGVLAALNKTQDRPQLHLDGEKPEPAPAPKKQEAFQTMPAETYRQMAAALAGGKKPDPERAQAAVRAMERAPLAQPVFIPRPQAELRPEPPRASEPAPVPAPPEEQPEPVQAVLPMPEEPSFTVLGELFRTYIVVQQGEEAFLIDKHRPPTSGFCLTSSGPRSRRLPLRPCWPLRCAVWVRRVRRWCWSSCPCWMNWGMAWKNLGRERCCCARLHGPLPGAGGGLPHQPGPGLARGKAGGPGRSAGSHPAHHGLQGRH